MNFPAKRLLSYIVVFLLSIAPTHISYAEETKGYKEYVVMFDTSLERKGIAITDRVLIIGSGEEGIYKNAATAEGIELQFYYIDLALQIEAYISSAPLAGAIPEEMLPPQIRELKSEVLKQIEQDGGVDFVYKKFLYEKKRD